MRSHDRPDKHTRRMSDGLVGLIVVAFCLMAMSLVGWFLWNAFTDAPELTTIIVVGAMVAVILMYSIGYAIERTALINDVGEGIDE